MDTETFKTLTQALTRALKDYQIQLDDKTALIQAYEQKINDLRAENRDLNESRKKWIDSWMTAGSELFELKEKVKAMEEATK